MGLILFLAIVYNKHEMYNLTKLELVFNGVVHLCYKKQHTSTNI